MNILYGVVGEGFGHATRSKVILDHISQDHEVMVVGSGKAYDYLGRYFGNIREIEGFELAIDEEGVNRKKSLARFLKTLPKKISTNGVAFAKVTFGFSPDVVISDFESFAYLLGATHRKPVISIDNMQALNRCDLDIELPLDTIDDYIFTKAVIKNKLPNCYHYLISTFFPADVKKERTSVFPPILREDVLEARRRWGKHILVYSTSGSEKGLLAELKKTDQKFLVYGFDKKEHDENLEYRPFSEEGFIDDLATSRGVIGNGGFSLISEAVFLGKPYLAIPVENQFEQFLNALYIRKLRYGEYFREPKKDDIKIFIENLEFYKKNLKRHKQNGNVEVLNHLDWLLNRIETGNDWKEYVEKSK